MRVRWVAAAVVPAVVLTGCGSGSKGSGGSDGRVGVVASTNVYGDMVRQIGGSHVDVTSILSDPNVDPHGYESNAKNAAEVADAKLVVENGLGYDDFMKELTSSAQSRGQTVVTASKVLGVSGGDANPHLWYDVPRMPKVADAIASALSEIDSKNSADYRKNAAKFKKSLQPIDAVLQAIKAKDGGAKIAYTERVAGYLLTDAGLKLGIPAGFPQSVEDGDDPSPGDTLAFDKALQKRTVRALIYNSQVTDKQTDQLKQKATGAGVPLVAVTETMPSKSSSYQAWQLKQAKQLQAALEKSA
ncbi:ABC transporter substrate-binding protein [Flexivirga endophytica]|uniref:ABC transporter substrate-binding protein n=1 Tax=Flexivirga endophytica TaxID=1849103 RepID=A0A916TAQ9_9MICO|nr:zinc ABC transporter substrate-binding protein [Flexivirga endophytica]GGB36438.1 ABC transporter substrate-binding protein [Flexivirga endophytica]GHB44130.1 ABC transporter substrate-binding protein [Flexivirga endophytica]